MTEKLKLNRFQKQFLEKAMLAAARGESLVINLAPIRFSTVQRILKEEAARRTIEQKVVADDRPEEDRRHADC